MGRRNRGQRLLEYAERRSSIFGQQTGCGPLSRTLSGRKRRRGWDGWPVQPRRLANATVLDVVLEEPDEAEEEEEEGRPRKRTRIQQEEQKLMDARTVVFGTGASADLRVGYVSTFTFNMIALIFFSDTNMSRLCSKTSYSPLRTR